MKRGIILIGAGNWGQSWLKFIHESNDWELAALVSRGGENLAKARQAWSIPEERVFSSLADALKGPGEVVLTTAPHHLHVPHALEAMAAGRTALIEKPLSDDFAQARQLADAKTGPGAYVVQNFRFRPGFWRIRRSIAAGELGDPLAVRLNFRIAGPRKAGAPPQACLDERIGQVGVHRDVPVRPADEGQRESCPTFFASGGLEQHRAAGGQKLA